MPAVIGRRPCPWFRPRLPSQPAQTVSFTPTGSFSTVGALTVSLPLIAASNTIEFANATSYAPDFDRIILAATPG